MYLGTGHKLLEEEFCYEPKHIEATQKYRFNILNGLTEREIDLLGEDIEILQNMLGSLIFEIDETLKNRK